jgi:hypothetical protein
MVALFITFLSWLAMRICGSSREGSKRDVMVLSTATGGNLQEDFAMELTHETNKTDLVK